MYLKILSRDDDRTNVLTDIRRVEFFHRVDAVKAIQDLINYADLSLVANELVQTEFEGNEGIVRIGCFNITHGSGKTQFIVFDGVAFLCNETGKAVERYLAN